MRRRCQPVGHRRAVLQIDQRVAVTAGGASAAWLRRRSRTLQHLSTQSCENPTESLAFAIDLQRDDSAWCCRSAGSWRRRRPGPSRQRPHRSGADGARTIRCRCPTVSAESTMITQRGQKTCRPRPWSPRLPTRRRLVPSAAASASPPSRRRALLEPSSGSEQKPLVVLGVIHSSSRIGTVAVGTLIRPRPRGTVVRCAGLVIASRVRLGLSCSRERRPWRLGHLRGTALVSSIWLKKARPKSMMPPSTSMSMGSTIANSTALAPRSRVA